MTRKSTTLLAGAAVLVLSALSIAACGGGGSRGASASTTPPKTASGRPATVGVENTSLGNVLVDTQGRTLYLFQKDSGTKSACFGACASAWPPLRATGKPTAGSGANASLLGTSARSDGKPQVTYNGHPVYLYTGDQKAGDTNGQGLTAFGGSWFGLTGSGSQVTAQPTSTGGGGNGY
jgi:predicted lipoprotein with Yx(FWY)xxD motif